MNKIADFILNEKNYLEKISQDFDTEKRNIMNGFKI